jgi:membrane associated rhomboid family serine protease
MVIILVNFVVLVFTTILESTSGNTYRTFLSLFGLVPGLFYKHPWAIVTSIFIHSGFWHFFGNMITLYFFGTFLARLVGQKKFLMVYFGGGILGSILYILLGAPLSIVVGASGAIYGIAGALVVMMPNLKVFVYFLLPMRLWVVVLLFFVLWSFIPGVAWQAHLGGLVAGLIAGYFFRKQGYYYS